METQYLRSNLGDGTIPPQATVDDQMRALTRAFRETEAKYKVEAEETAKDLLRLTGELNKRDKAYRQLKQFCEEQEVLKDTMKAQQQAELQRNHERRVDALKLVETSEHEKVKVVDELERIKVINGTIKDEARNAQVRHTAELDESNASFERQTVVLTECQTEVGRLDAECKQLTLQYNENNVVMQTLTAENEACENARLAAVSVCKKHRPRSGLRVSLCPLLGLWGGFFNLSCSPWSCFFLLLLRVQVAELRTSELCREQEAEAHQKRLADLTQQTEEILSLKAQLKTSNSNAEYMEQRGKRCSRGGGGGG